MTLAIMQPYFLPYIGYVQLMNTVDKFVFYDDVAFINRGWVNRNRILVGGKDFMFTVPLKDASQNKRICDIALADDPKWRGKLLQTIGQSYRKAPFYETVMPMMEKIVNFDAPTVADYIFHSFTELTAYLDITTALVPSSALYENEALKAQERILDICRWEGTTHYINPVGGQALYDKQNFADLGMKLSFIQATKREYPQTGNKGEFVPWLSILDVLMNNDVLTVRLMLNDFELI